MNYGYNLAAAGVVTAMFRQDVASNNLANVETVGFKPDSAFTIPRRAARQEDHLENLPSNALLERLGAGVLLAPTRTSHAQGPLVKSGNALDVAIEGDGFFVVGASGQGPGTAGQQIRLTRDGRFTLNARGELVMVAGGLPVLDESGRAIRLDGSRAVQIDEDGAIRQGGQEVARLRLASAADPSRLRKVGHNLFAAGSEALDQRAAATGRVRQNHLEQSAVDPIQAMMAVQNAASAVTTATRAMSLHDEITGRLITTLGRVTA